MLYKALPMGRAFFLDEVFDCMSVPEINYEIRRKIKACLNRAVLDDEIRRNELEGNFVDGKELFFRQSRILCNTVTISFWRPIEHTQENRMLMKYNGWKTD